MVIDNHKIHLLILVTFFIFFASFLSCKNIENQNIQLTWSVEDNFKEENSYLSSIEIANQGSNMFSSKGWVLYFNNLRPVQPESFPGTLRLTHINGDFYKIEPTESFKSIQPGESYSFSFATAGTAIKKSDAPDGFYFVFENGEIFDIPDLNVEPFTDEKQYKRGPDDPLEYADAEYYYNKYEPAYSYTGSEFGKITPVPYQTNSEGEPFIFEKDLTIYYEPELQNEAMVLAKIVYEETGVQPELSTDMPGQNDADIYLITGNIQIAGSAKRTESYQLRVNGNQIRITGSDRPGVFYGIQSLQSLLHSDLKVFDSGPASLPAVHILDFPRFDYRGFHLDVARNFQSAESVKKLLDVMSHYKLNKFHFHLTDDEGWRIEISGLPELTEVGGRRGHTSDETDHLIPSYGSGPDPDNSKGSGWYSQSDYIDLLLFAKERHIEVIPEIDLPGHARAAIVAMKSRTLKTGDESFRLDEPEDESEYRSIQGWDDNVINVCQESSFRFIETVMDELIEMHREAGAALQTVHVGGDEVPGGVWQKSPACKNLINENEELDSAEDLQNYFFRRTQSILNERDLQMAGWEEVALVHPENGEPVSVNETFTGTFTPYVWSNVWGGGREDYAYKLANAGYRVIMSHATDFYFDMAYDHHPEEPGFYWAAFIDAKKPFGFIPYDLFKNGITDYTGKPLPESYFDNKVKLKESARKNILGLQGQLWGETLKSEERVDYMALPRIISLSERAWSPKPDWSSIDGRQEREEEKNRAWAEFAQRMGHIEFPKLDKNKKLYHYRISPPGMIVEDGLIRMNTEFPGQDIRYTLDGSEPDSNSSFYEKPVPIEKGASIKAKTFSTNNRYSRTITLLY